MNKRKRQVIQSSLELFTEKGFQQTSIQDIIKRANISKGTFYNYFSSKSECIIAILEQSRYEASLRRHELLLGQDPSDIEILAHQTAVLMKINQEQNLFTLFEGIFHSGDEEMKKLLAHHRLYEIQWLNERLVDVFGEEARPYTYECTVLFFGMVQHLAISYRTTYESKLDPVDLSHVALRHISAILPNMIAKKEVLLTSDGIKLLENKLVKTEITATIIVNRLNGFYERLNEHDPQPVGKQFTLTLLEEFAKQTPRFAVIEALLKPFRESFQNTSHEAESKELANFMWVLVKQGNT